MPAINPAVIQTWIPCTTPAPVLIKKLQRLLKLRYERRINRKMFLCAWGVTRKQLSRTREYAEWRNAIFDQGKNRCAKCKSATTLVAHHKVLVSRDPRKALDLTNGELRCRECHTVDHPHMAEVAA